MLQKKARELCRREGKAWILKDFEHGVSGSRWRPDLR